MFCGARPNMGSVCKSQCQFMLCLLGGKGVGAWGGCNCANRCSPESRLGGKRWLEPKRPTPQPADQATRYLAQIYWPPPCALPNLNNFAKAHKAFCRFWCLGLQDANIGVLQFRREGGGALGPRTLRLGGCAAKKEDNKHPPTQNSKFCETQTNKMEESHNSETICQDTRKSLNSKQP